MRKNLPLIGILLFLALLLTAIIYPVYRRAVEMCHTCGPTGVAKEISLYVDNNKKLPDSLDQIFSHTPYFDGTWVHHKQKINGRMYGIAASGLKNGWSSVTEKDIIAAIRSDKGFYNGPDCVVVAVKGGRAQK